VAGHRERLGRVLGERACAVDPADRTTSPPTPLSATCRYEADLMVIAGGGCSREVPQFQVRASGLIGDVEITG
jgi:hypothetical protein